MMTRETLPSLVTWKSYISMIHLALFILFLMLLPSSLLKNPSLSGA